MKTDYEKKLDSLCNVIVSASKFGLSHGLHKEDVVQALMDNAILACYHCGLNKQQCIQVFVNEVEHIASQKGIVWGT